MNKIEEFINYYNKDNINMSSQHLTKEKNRLKTIFKEYELNNSIKKTPLLKTFLMYCDLNDNNNNNEPEPERKEEKNINTEPNTYYVNLPNFEQYMAGLNDMDNGKKVAPNDIIKDVHFTAKEAYRERIRKKWKSEYPYKDKFVRYGYFSKATGHLHKRVEYLEDLLTLNKIEFEHDDY